MNRLRRFLIAAIMVAATATLAVGGVIQGPAKSDPPPPPVSASTGRGLTPSTSIEQIQIAWPNATTMLMDLLLTIY